MGRRKEEWDVTECKIEAKDEVKEEAKEEMTMNRLHTMDNGDIWSKSFLTCLCTM